MAKHSFARLLTAAILALLMSALLTAPGLADEGEPPAPTDPAVTETAPEPSGDETIPTEESTNQPIPDPSIEETATVAVESTDDASEDLSLSDEHVETEGAADTADLLAEFPEGTELIVLDETGAPIPLASDEASEILAAGDPIWCPLGVAPVSLTGGCSFAYADMDDLVADVGAAFFPAANGVIWITGFSVGGADTSAGPITFNGGLGGAWTTWSAFSLSFKGGWTGVGSTIDTTDPSFFNQPITITSWAGDVSLNDIFATAIGPFATGLTIETTKNIVLTRVYANNSSYRGALLDNYVAGTGTGNVNITSSTFSNNGGGGGVGVNSGGTITLTTVTANDNTDQAMELFNNLAASAKNVTLSGVEIIGNSGAGGLRIDSKGAVSIKDITASNNGGAGYGTDNGARINNTFGSSGVTLTGTNIFTDNVDYGLQISSAGAVKLNNVIANSNGAAGLYINNTSAGPAQPVTLTGSSAFVFNGAYGLEIYSDGMITLSNITANFNGGYGAFLENITGPGVTITGTSSFNENVNEGLYVGSKGAISVSNITANNNTGSGVYLDNHYDATSPYPTVKVTGINTFNGNLYNGLSVWTNGAISVNSITALGNSLGSGAILQNVADSLTNSKQPVSVTGTNKLNENYTYGLYIASYGAVTLNNITANENGFTGTGQGLYVINRNADTPVSVTVNGVNSFNDNYNDGIWVESRGTIKFNTTTATGNGSGVGGGYGAKLDNNYSGALGGVTLTGTSVFSENETAGLYITTKGAVALSSVTASSNLGGNGAFINNTYDNCIDLGSGCTVLSPKGVTISGTNVFNDNWLEGLFVFTYGAITLNSTTANGNGISGAGDGVMLDNCLTAPNCAVVPKGVTLSGTSSFADNASSGLNIFSFGLIKINNVSATSNDDDGARLFNNILGASSGVTLTGTNSFNSNDDLGLNISTKGAITVNSVNASSNGADGTGGGAQLTNAAAVLAQKVTMTGTNVFNGNNGAGLQITSIGAVSLQNVYAVGNLTSVGVETDNCYDLGSGCTGSGAVTISGTNNFSGNFDSGLTVESNGAITINNITASSNGLVSGYGVGADLQNYFSTTVQKVALTGTNTFSTNRTYGLFIKTKGAITSATKITASNNQSYGAILDNNESGAVGGVTLSGTNTFSGNTYHGLDANSLGAISVSKLTADGNGWSGAVLTNSSAASAMNVTISGITHVSENGDDGIHVESDGAISVSSVTADSNGEEGLELLNNGASTDGKGVTISGTNMVTNSTEYGVVIYSKGPITVNSLTSSFNGNSGGWIQNNFAATAQTVKLTGTNKFENNNESGLTIYSMGSITLNNITSSDNGSSGVYDGVHIDNDPGGATANVTLTGTNIFLGNTQNGLYMETLGAVSVSKITADGNGLTGMVVNGPAAKVTITCGSFTNNSHDGLWVNTNGVLTLKGVVASGNTDQDLVLFGWSDLVESLTC